LWTALLVCLFCVLQYRLWIADGSIPNVQHLQAKVDSKQNGVKVMQAQNHALEAEVANLKSGDKAIEGWARSELGMIGQGESFYLLVHQPEMSFKTAHSTPQ